MVSDSRTKSPLLALAGVALIAIYFWLFSSTRVASLLQFDLSKASVIAKAEQAFQQSDVAHYDLRREVDLDVDKELIEYLQITGRAEDAPFYPEIGRWEFSWEGEVKPANESEEKSVRYGLSYGLDGSLLGLNKSDPFSPKGAALSEAEALAQAKINLSAFQIDTSQIKLEKKTASEKDSTLSFRFTFSGPSPSSRDLVREYTTEMSGTQLTSFRSEINVDESRFKAPKINELSEQVGAILAGVIWLIVGIFLLTVFIKRLRHDEIEFKRALWLGCGIALIMWIMVGLNSRSEWLGILIGGGFAGLFTGFGMLIAYAGTESLTRETWPDRLAISDLLFRGTLRFREMGKAILEAFFNAGLGLVLFGAVVWVADASGLGYLDLDDDNLWVFLGPFETASAVCQSVVEAAYLGLIMLVFWAGYLRSKVKKDGTLVAFVALTFLLSGQHLHYLRPSYLAVFLVAPVAVFWGYLAVKRDFVTLLLSLFGYLYLSDFSVAVFANQTFTEPAGMATIALGAVLFTGALISLYSKNSVQDFAHYVPEYVSRIAQRERLLKELEIARQVQMRFLPQQIPDFPKLDISCICRPAQEVGGDYYDFLAKSDSHLSVLIGDVSGKGVSAAFYMTMTSGIVRTLSKRIKSPKTILSELNEVFFEYTPKEVFISVIYGLFDLENKTLTFARAGHNPVMGWKSVGGETQILDSKGIAVGLESGALFSRTIEEKTVSIDSGDLFVFYTDGLSEAMNHRADEFGEDRLRELITSHAHEDANAFLTRVTGEVKKFVGDAEQHDDLTMVVVKVK